MADVSLEQLTKDFGDLTTALQELGVVGNTYGKTAGLMEKSQSKLKAAFNKNPIVQVSKSFWRAGKQLKIFAKVTTHLTKEGEKDNKERMKSATGLTKLAIHMFSLTKIAERLTDATTNQVSWWRRLTMALFGIVSIFLLVGFAIAAISIAFQGASTPLLDFTEGIPVLDEALKGLIMVLTGEGEGGLYGALNLLALALVIVIPLWFLFGGPIALVAGLLIAVVGVFQLVKQATDNTGIAFAAATATAMLLVAAFLIIKAVVINVMAGTLLAVKTTLAYSIGMVLIGFGLIIGGVVGLYMFMTGKVSGWLGWAVAIISSAAIAGGLALVIGFGIVPFAIIAAVIFVVVVIYKYWNEISNFFIMCWNGFLYGLTQTIMWILQGIGSIFIYIGIVLTSVIGGLILFVGTIVGILVFPFIFLKNLAISMFVTFMRAKDRGWAGIMLWVVSLPKQVGAAFESGFKTVFNGVIGIYNSFAEMMEFEIPEWVPIIGGQEWSLPIIPKLAKGGIVNSPTLALIGEDGPEAVVPLSKKNNPQGIGLGGSNGPITINVNASGITDRSDKRALAREIGEAIREEMSRGGRSMGTRRGAL